MKCGKCLCFSLFLSGLHITNVTLNSMEFLMYYPKKVEGVLCGYRSPTSTLCLTDQQVQGENPQPDGLKAIPASVSIGEEPKDCFPGTAVPATQTPSPSIVATARPTKMTTSSPVNGSSSNPTAAPSQATFAPSLNQPQGTTAPSTETTTTDPPSGTPPTAPPTNAQTEQLETKPPSKNFGPDRTSLSMIVALILYVACVNTIV